MAGRIDFTSVDPEDTEAAQAPRQGSLWAFSLRFINFDAAGCVARMMLRKGFNDTEPAMSLTEAATEFIWVSRGGPSTNAELQVIVAATKLATVKARDYFYDLELVRNGVEAEAEAMIYGIVALQPEATK